MEIKTNGTQAFSVSNDFMGQTFISMLRNTLNKDRYEIKVRARGKNRLEKNNGKRTWGGEIPISKADWLAVYIVAKESDYWKGFERGQESERDSITRMIENRGGR